MAGSNKTAEKNMAGASSRSAGAGHICSSCYDGFLPVVKHLQSLTAHGHAFHEPCIQQLFSSCWNEEMSFCPVSNTNVRRLKSQSVPNSCPCEESLKKRRKDTKQLKGKVSRECIKREPDVESSQTCNEEETMGRLLLDMKEVLPMFTRVDHLLNKYFAKEVPLEIKPCNDPFGGNVGISNQCNQLSVVEPVKLSPSKIHDKAGDTSRTELRLGPIGTTRGKHGVGENVGILTRCVLQSADTMKLSPRKPIIKGSDNLKAEATIGTELALVPSATIQTNIKGSDKLKAEANLMSELSLGSVKTSPGHCSTGGDVRSQFAEPVKSSPSKRNIEGTDDFKAQASSRSELALESIGTTVAQCNIGGNIGISDGQILSADPVRLSPSRTNTMGCDSFKAEATPSTELSRRSIGTTIEQCVGGNVGFHCRCNESQPMEMESVASIGTTMGQCDGGTDGLHNRCKKHQSIETESTSASMGTTMGQHVQGNVGLHNKCNKNQSIETESTSSSIGTTMGQRVGGNVGLHYRCNKNQSIDSESTLASVGTTRGQCNVYLAKTCNKCQFPMDWDSGTSKRNKKSPDNLNADATSQTKPSFGSISTTTAAQCSDYGDPYSIGSCLTIINQMQDLNPSVSSAARYLFENPNWRKIFVRLKKEKRLIWLISMLPGVQ